MMGAFLYVQRCNGGWTSAMTVITCYVVPLLFLQ